MGNPCQRRTSRGGLGELGQRGRCRTQGDMKIADQNLGNSGRCWQRLPGGMEFLHQMVLYEADIANEAWMSIKFDWKDSWLVANKDTAS
ncbi:hypothetical protein C1H46_008766 [Malus baccata]|uniref:Uncharacterized protein n=1 Tax=Malus baccata TaxID=106549 RepID=A0A540N516_MALBA|nr:hypothetical protein C1H46_008766 [Malus baccata]